MKNRITKKAVNLLFDFWKDNQVSGHFQLNAQQLKLRFGVWLPTKELSWLNYYGAERIIRVFITDSNEGLSSVFEESQFEDIYEILKPDYLKYAKENEHKLEEVKS